MERKIIASLFVAYILGILFVGVVAKSTPSWWGIVVYSVFVGFAMSGIATVLARLVNDD